MLGPWAEVVIAGDVGHYAGIKTCASPHSCTVCAIKIAVGRVDEIGAALTLGRLDGRHVLFLTGTFSHNAAQSLEQLWDARQEAWRHFTRSTAWRRLRKAQRVEYVRALEHTWGPATGWHPHVHVALVVDDVQAGGELAALEAELGAAWRASLVKAGLSGSVAHALRLEAWSDDQAAGDLAGYLAKQLALEVAGGPLKEGRRGRFSVWGLLIAAMDGEAFGVHRWREHEKASHGRRSISWSQGMAKYRPVEETTDEELAAAEVGGRVLLAFDARTKGALWRASPRGVGALEAAEEGDRQGIAYVEALAPPGADVIPYPRGEP